MFHRAAEPRNDAVKDIALVEQCLKTASWLLKHIKRPVDKDPLHDSDAGSHHPSLRHTDTLEIEGLIPSIGNIGDNAPSSLLFHFSVWFSRVRQKILKSVLVHVLPISSSPRTGPNHLANKAL